MNSLLAPIAAIVLGGGSLVHLLVTLLVIGLVIWLVVWVVGLLPIPAAPKQIIYAILGIALLAWLLNSLGVLL